MHWYFWLGLGVALGAAGGIFAYRWVRANFGRVASKLTEKM